VLASLLPGVRELRAPLAAGYLWLLAAWLLFYDNVPSKEEASGAVDALCGLNDAATAIGLAIALSFLAYIIGSLSQALTDSLVRVHELAGQELLPDPQSHTPSRPIGGGSRYCVRLEPNHSPLQHERPS
jgi:hypothetical protein